MSMLDIFAWIVLIVLVASTVARRLHGDAARHDRHEAATIPGRRR